MCQENNPFPTFVPEDGKIIGYGATSTVYLLPDDTVCKVFRPEFSTHEIQREYRMAENAYRLGIRVPKPGGIVQFKDSIGIRSEFVDGKSLAELLSGNHENYSKLFPKYLSELRHFHETAAEPEDFVSAKELYLEKIRALYETDWYSTDELRKMELLVQSVPDRNTLIYGDYHPKNILVKKDELVFVDLGDICIGHPVFDFAMIANTHFIIPSVNPSFTEKYFAVSSEILIQLWNDLFHQYFNDISLEKQTAIKKEIMAFAILRQGLSPADGRSFPENILKENVAVTKNKLLPEIDSVIGSIDW